AMGGGPAFRNRDNSGRKPAPPARGETGKPVMTVCGGQSGCLSASIFENRARTRSGEWLSPNGFTSVAGGKSSSARSRYHGFARNRVVRLPSHSIADRLRGPNQRKGADRTAGDRKSGV